ncbi:MAG: hypothetical protein M0R76_06970 [Proteobacteria bacterium]|jgi:hypothetical protein|nr:hypothetical protein [Pseudomonadota bacterium]NLN62726.1 hypothetical protein [Myxococcales bacterium]
MTIPMLVVFNMMFGASTAYGARVQIKNLQRPIFYNRYFAVIALFQVLLTLPAGAYFTAFYPDWAWMYLIDTSRTALGIHVMALLASPLAATAGYVIGYFSARSNSDWVTLLFLAFLGLAFAGLFAVAWDKIGYLGTYQQFHHRLNLVPFTQTSLFPSMIIAVLGLFAAAGYTGYRFWHEGALSSAYPKH